MHVVHISSVHRAGDPRIRLKQLTSIVRAGWRATFVTGDLEAEAGDGIEIVKVAPGRAARLARMLVTAPRAILAARRLRADLYHLHDPELLPWAFLLALSGKPVIYDIHEDYGSGVAQKRYLPDAVQRPMAAIAAGAETALAAPLHQIVAERYYRRRFPRALEILNYPAVELPLGRPAFDATSTSLLYTGNLTETRGADVLARLASDHRAFAVTAIGYCGPSLAERLRAAAGGGQLTLVGAGRYVPFAEIAAAYRQAWLAGLAVFPDTPHYREKELTKLFEYMAAGLPIIASDFPAWRELIEGNGTGICVPPGDSKAMAYAAHWLRAHPKAGHDMAVRGQELVATRFNWQAEGERLVEYYRSLTATTGGRQASDALAAPGTGLRIAYILPAFPVASETFAVSDIAALRQLGHSVSVHCLKPEPRGARALGVRMGLPSSTPITYGGWRRALSALPHLVRRSGLALRLGGLCAAGLLRNPGTALSAFACIPRALQIADEVEAADADIVHAFWGRHPSLILHALARLGDTRGPVRSLFVGAYDLVRADFLVEMGLRSADTVFTHSRANLEFFAERGRPDVAVVHRGIPLELDPGGELSRHPDVIATCSSLVVKKNVEAVIRTFARLRRARPELKLWIIGGGPDGARLRAIAEDLGLGASITFWGQVSRQEVFARLKQASLFLFLSTKASERLPNVVKEALYAGCYVVTARSEGIEELLTSPRWGSIVEPDDNAAIDAAVLKGLDENEDDARARRQEAHRFISESMSSTENMRRYVERWMAALGKAKTTAPRKLDKVPP